MDTIGRVYELLRTNPATTLLSAAAAAVTSSLPLARRKVAGAFAAAEATSSKSILSESRERGRANQDRSITISNSTHVVVKNKDTDNSSKLSRDKNTCVIPPDTTRRKMN